MSHGGSTLEKPFPAPLALAVTAVGIVAMVLGAGFVAARSGLGLRGQIAAGTLLLVAPALLALAVRPGWWPAVSGQPITSRAAFLSAVLGGALWLASAGLMEVQSLVLPPPPEYLDAFRAIHAALAPKGPLDALVSVLVIAVLPGVCEELLVRGVFLPAVARRAGAMRAVLISALLFAAIHLDGFRFLFTFALGLVFGFLRVRTGSLWPSVIAHTALNTLTFLVAPFVDDPSQPYVPSPALGAACLVAGSVVAWPLLRALGAFVDSPRRGP